MICLQRVGRGGTTPEEPLGHVSVITGHFLNSPSENPEILRKLYLDFGLSQGEIDDLTESAWPRTSVLENLQIHGIHRPTTPGRRLKYGERVVKGRVVSHPGEQKILALMRSLASEGRAPYGVAKYLNLKGIKGKRGGRWDTSTVRTILGRG